MSNLQINDLDVITVLPNVSSSIHASYACVETMTWAGPNYAIGYANALAIGYFTATQTLTTATVWWNPTMTTSHASAMARATSRMSASSYNAWSYSTSLGFSS